MKVTFPHMGYLNISLQTALTNLGIDIVQLPQVSKKTIELGSLYSPEGACLPYKITMGNFLEGIECGADTMITVCGAGKCRLGFYNALQRITLAKKGNFNVFTIDTDHMLKSLYRCLRALSPSRSRFAVVKNIAFAVKTLQALDQMNNCKNTYGACSKLSEEIITLYNSGAQQLLSCKSFSDVERIRETICDMIKTLADGRDEKPLKVGLIGEFYVLLEPYVNHSIENLLIRQGVQVKKFVNAGEWAYAQTLLSALGLYNEEKACIKTARPYLNHHIGGEGARSVSSALWCAKNDFDGLIHIYPFGCMPEVVAQSALKNIGRNYNIPILFLSLDEHSSDVGIITRIEAFVDCIKRRNYRPSLK